MKIEKLFFTPKEVAEELNKLYEGKKEFVENDIRCMCRYPLGLGESGFEHIKKGNRYFITRKGLEKALKFFSPEETKSREERALKYMGDLMKGNKYKK
jgi:hypothetical protein